MSETYKGQLRLVVKQFPSPAHAFARDASQASLAAYRQGKFWQFRKELFENYKSLDDDRIMSIAKGLKLDMHRFLKDMSSSQVQQIIDSDIANGIKIGVTGTPTVFINGKMVDLGSPGEFIRKIESEILKNSR